MKIANHNTRDCDSFDAFFYFTHTLLPHHNVCTISACNCDASGSTEEVCTKSLGNCLCKEGYGGERCDQCQDGWFGYPNCQRCECSPEGTSTDDGKCDQVTGQCPCKRNFGGRQCETCTPGNYDYPNCFSKSI